MSTRSWKRARFAYATEPGCGSTVAGKGFWCCNETLGHHFTTNRAACCASDPFASPVSCPGSLGAIVPQDTGGGSGGAPNTPFDLNSIFKGDCAGLPVPCIVPLGTAVALLLMLVIR